MPDVHPGVSALRRELAAPQGRFNIEGNAIGYKEQNTNLVVTDKWRSVRADVVDMLMYTDGNDETAGYTEGEQKSFISCRLSKTVDVIVVFVFVCLSWL